MAKLHDINSQLVEDQGFLDLLKELLSDSTPMVVANAVAALAEIGDVSPTGKNEKKYNLKFRTPLAYGLGQSYRPSWSHQLRCTVILDNLGVLFRGVASYHP